jgi:hypothetical protein
MDQNRHAELDDLFASYRNAVEIPEASPEFMPGLWTRIEQRRTVSYSLRRMTSGFVTAAAAICLVMTLAMWLPSPGSVSTYVDVLADDAGSALVEQVDAQ